MAHLLCVHWYLAGLPYRTAWCNSVAPVLHGGTHAMVELHRRDILEEVAPQRLQLDQPLGVSRARTAYSLKYSLRYSRKYSRGTHLQLEQPLGVGQERRTH